MAFDEAKKSYDMDEIPVGCVIVKENKIISSAHNCKEYQKNAIMHAELLAIDKACKVIGDWRLDNCELYTTLEPCMMCMGAILWANIEKIYYGCNVIDTEDIGFRDKKFYEDDNKNMLEELDRDACLKLYDEYKKIENKINY